MNPVIGVILYDKTSGSAMNTNLMGSLSKPLDPGKSVIFDIDTTYTAPQANQFQHMTVAFVTTGG